MTTSKISIKAAIPTTGELDASATPILALRPKAAAKALGIGERLLWSLTKDGIIPHVRIGRAVVYPVGQLLEYLHEKSQESVSTGPEASD